MSGGVGGVVAVQGQSRRRDTRYRGCPFAVLPDADSFDIGRAVAAQNTSAAALSAAPSVQTPRDPALAWTAVDASAHRDAGMNASGSHEASRSARRLSKAAIGPVSGARGGERANAPTRPKAPIAQWEIM